MQPTRFVEIIAQHFRFYLFIIRGGARHLHLGGATGGASFATRGAVNGLCRTFRKRPEKFLGGHWGGAGKIWGGQWPPLAPPLFIIIIIIFRPLRRFKQS